MGDGPGRKRRDGLTTEAERFRWLVLQLQDEGMSQPEIARRTGIGVAYINAMVNYETSRRSGIGAEIVRMVKTGLGIDADYFFDDYKGQRPYKLYLLNAEREKARRAEQERKLVEMNQRMLEAEARSAAAESRVATLAAQMETRLAALEGRDSSSEHAPSMKKKARL